MVARQSDFITQDRGGTRLENEKGAESRTLHFLDYCMECDLSHRHLAAPKEQERKALALIGDYAMYLNDGGLPSGKLVGSHPRLPCFRM